MTDIYFPVPEAGEVRSRHQQIHRLGSGSQTAAFSLCAPRVEGTRQLSGSLYKGTKPIHEGSTLTS